MTATTQVRAPSLELPAPLCARVEAVSRASYPHEACGLLLGRRSGTSTAVTHVREARNLSTQPKERFDLHPEDHLAAEELALAAGVEVVGLWHSHPDGPARPSEADRALAWRGWSYVIVSVNAGTAAELRSWRLVDERFVEEQVLCPPEPAERRP